MPPTYDANTVPAISVSELTHAFKGHQALNQVSFAVMPQTLHGFVGPNGAGKTTTLKVICTLLKPNWGQVQVFGHSVRSEPIAVREKIGFMPDHFSMYRQMTVFEYLDFFAAAYGLKMTQRDQVINDVLTLTDMDGRRNDLISGLSRGMQQRVSLARVLVHDPDLLLLDEPASGLDPRARIELMEILRELRRMGKTIFISSHILSELAELCDSVTIIDRGHVKFSGPMDALLDADAEVSRFTLKFSQAPENATELLTAIDGIVSAEIPEYSSGNEFDLELDPASDSNIVLSSIIGLGVPIVSFAQRRKQLNQAFMDLTTRGVRP
ncbi:ABC transporter ATP-binding protein [Fuerstiella marisgermanici]|uniref:Putative ABC transporter ATP-binding protein YxlF n=1 Tax=Fuerstiella marisgermanici TaxID=1891926 RepID=A0A1P8WQK8_9PLAN|nr:ABC transporter ATP-binding protein [Fuerstiella marisgermanici]APZ96332.1 putative ABC transporter ATP-binding protein YxlF [Fuerstiella marisgermanici]